MLRVNEIFKSFQGEGIDIGLPMVFIRFSGCNLACKYCDTKYASSKLEKWNELTFPQVVDEVGRFGDVAGVTLTGGEPFIQNMEDIDWLIYELKGKGYFINIETNGIIFPKLTNGKLVDRFSISPKLNSSKNKIITLNPGTLNNYINSYLHKIFFKFVISNRTDFVEMLDFLKTLHNFQNLNVPVVIQPNITNKKAESLAKQNKEFLKLLNLMFKEFSKESKEYKIRIIPQFHKYLYKNQKSV